MEFNLIIFNKKLRKDFIANNFYLRILGALKFIIITIIIFTSTNAFAISCGDGINSNIILNSSLNCNSSYALNLLSGTLNCNNYSINGNENNIGLRINGRRNIKIINCYLNNFSRAIDISNSRKLEGNGWGAFWYETIYSENILIENNSFNFNKIGINSNGDKNELVRDNIFNNSYEYGIKTNSISTKIYNNSFYNKSIYYPSTSGKSFGFVKNNTIFENKYFNNLTGPKYNCIIPFSNLDINSKINFCKNNYTNISNLNLLDNGRVNCSNSIFIGKEDINLFRISGSKNTEVSNCIILNYSTGISSNYKRIRMPGVLGGSYYQDIYPRNNMIDNNIFIGNIKAVNLKDSYDDVIKNNIFKNNKENSIYLNTKTSLIYNNSFYNKTIYYTETSGKYFCKNNISNRYFNISGPKCNCIIPFSNLKINSKVNFCKDSYSNISNLNLRTNGKINCRNSIFNGEQNQNLFRILGSYNTKISNCIINNYSNGVIYTYERRRNGYNYLNYYSRNNEINNSIFINNKNGIYTNSNSNVENIHNSIFKNNIYNIYNKNKKIINASNNYWFINAFNSFSPYNNSFNTFFKTYFNKYQYIYFEPKNIIGNNSIDYWINSSSLFIKKGINDDFEKNKNISFSFDLERNYFNLIENIRKVNSEFNLNPYENKRNSLNQIEILIYEINKNQDKIQNKDPNQILNKKIIQIKLNDFKLRKKIYIENFKINSMNNRIGILIDPFQKLKENKENRENNKIEFNMKKSIILNFNTSNIEKEKIKNLTEFYVENKFNFKIENFSSMNSSNLNNYIICINLNNQENLTKLDDNSSIEYKIVSNISKKEITITIYNQYFLYPALFDLYNNQEIYFNINKIKISNGTSRKINSTLNFENLKKIVLNQRYKEENLSLEIGFNERDDFDFLNKTRNGLEFNYIYNYSVIHYKPILNNKINGMNEINEMNKTNSGVDILKTPIVLAGGLWSDINTWRKYGEELASQGKDVYLIELTGNDFENKRDSYNYNYEDLIKIVFPKYMNFVLNNSNSSKLIYIGHSNGARVSIDSLNKGYFNKSKILALINVGVPGSFEGESPISNILKDMKLNTSRYLEHGINHISLNRIILEGKIKGEFRLKPHLNMDFNYVYSNKNPRISVNLFNQYLNWIKNNSDLEPGINLSLNNYLIIGGKILNSDMVVPIEDINNIYNNINSKNKKERILLGVSHMGMSENKRVINSINKFLMNLNLDLNLTGGKENE